MISSSSNSTSVWPTSHHHRTLSASSASSQQHHSPFTTSGEMRNQTSTTDQHVHVVLIKDRPLTVIKADLIHTFFSSPDVVHQILSPMSFRVEFKRPSGTSSMFQRSVKLQIDIAPASSSMNTAYNPPKASSQLSADNGASSSTPNAAASRTGSFRSVYCLTFTLISGPYQRFKRICENMQHQLLNHKINYVINKAQPVNHSIATEYAPAQSHTIKNAELTRKKTS